MTAALPDAQISAFQYDVLRHLLEQIQDTVPGKVEITKEGLVHDMMNPGGPHELTAMRVSRRLEQVMPDDLAAHTGTPDVENPVEGIMRHPDVMVIAESDMEVQGSFEPRAVIAAVEIVSRSNPDNDWVGKVRDYPLLGIPVYAIFDPRTGSGTVLSDIHPTPQGPRYATRKDFLYGEDVTIAGWTISTDGLPRYGPTPRDLPQDTTRRTG